MRKIEKDLTDIPKTLVVSNKQLTHKRRKELISAGKYIDGTIYDSRYKIDDIKEKMRTLYYNKCAYCENYAEQTHVDHFRPKKEYYWLAYSWDNLICSCPRCNQFKKNNFKIKGKKAIPPKNTDNLNDINIWSSQIYDYQEKPLLLNPERDDLNGVFSFDKKGHIIGNGKRARYTIETCQLDRKDLVDERRKILDEYREAIEAELINASSLTDQRYAVEVLTRDFQRKSKDIKSRFFAYRNAALCWLDDIVKEIVKKTNNN